MKKFLTMICAVLALSGCKYDDGDLWERVDGLDKRIEALEGTVAEMNGQIGSMKTIVDALKSGAVITEVTETETGYTIRLSDDRTLKIENGKNGADAPVIGVGQDEDGAWYWTVTTDGQTNWLSSGNKDRFPVSGSNGVTPTLGIDAEGYWTVDTGNGPENIYSGNDKVSALGKEGEPGEDGDSFFRSVTQDEEHVYFTLADGTVLTVAKLVGASFRFADQEAAALYYGATVELMLEAEGMRSALVTAPCGWRASVNITQKKVKLTAPVQIDTEAEFQGYISVIGVTEKDQTVTISKAVGTTETIPSTKEINDILNTLLAPIVSAETPLALNFVVSGPVSYDGIDIPAEFTKENVPSMTFTLAQGGTGSFNIGAYNATYDGAIHVILPEGKTMNSASIQVPKGSATVSGAGTYSYVSANTSGGLTVDAGTPVTKIALNGGTLMVFGKVETLTISTGKAVDVLKTGHIGTIEDSQGYATVVTPRPASSSSSKWISEVLEYRPAPGQFMNVAWSLPENVAALVGKNASTGVTLGTFGGSVTFKFDHSIINFNGTDFVIHGNAFKTSNEPGAVQVAYDRNGNGVPDDDEWYELKGAAYGLPTTVKDYEMTFVKPDDVTTKAPIDWTDNQGGSGTFPAGFYNRTYWPTMLEGDRLTYKGNRIDLTGTNTILEYGYADNYSADYTKVVGDDPDTRSANKFDIDWAVDASGNTVKLVAIDFIRVYNPVYSVSSFGETSTEICGAISVNVARAAQLAPKSTAAGWNNGSAF